MASSPDVTKEEDLVRRMKKEFKRIVVPFHIMDHLDIRSLTTQEESRIKAKEDRLGAMAASADLLDYLCRKQDWFPKLIKVLRVEELKLNHLADIFEKIKAEVDEEWRSGDKLTKSSSLTQNRNSEGNTFQFGNPVEGQQSSKYKTDTGGKKATQSKQSAVGETYSDVRSTPDKSELRQRILTYLESNRTPQNTLDIAKACDCAVCKDINPVLYNLQKEGLITKCSGTPVFWQISEMYDYPELSSQSASSAEKSSLSTGFSSLGIRQGDDCEGAAEDDNDEIYELISDTVQCENNQHVQDVSVIVRHDIEPKIVDNVQAPTYVNQAYVCHEGTIGHAEDTPFEGAVGQSDGRKNHQDQIWNTETESSKYLTKASSKVGRNFTKEEVTRGLENLSGWRPVNTDTEVLDIMNDYLRNDGAYILWYREHNARPAISVIYCKEIVTFIIHKRLRPSKPIFYIAEDQKIGATLEEVVLFHVGQNGIRDTRKDRKTYRQIIPLCKPL